MNARFINRLKQELIPAMGCTEPIAICYGAAKAREILGKFPESISIAVSGSLYKNAKGVFIPNTQGLTGVKMSAIVGVIGGEAGKKLEVLGSVTEEDIQKALEYVETDFCTVELLKDGNNIHAIIEAFHGSEKVVVEIVDSHTNIVYIEKNGEVCCDKRVLGAETAQKERPLYEDIFTFINEVSTEAIKALIEPQINYNYKLATHGLSVASGLEVGQMLAETTDMTDPFMKARAYTSAACDARMEGASLPAITNGGSGNQGITCSVPVYVYGIEKGFPMDEIMKAIALSDLTFLYLKEDIGLLSSYCSGILSAASAACGWMYLETKNIDDIKHVLVNTIGNISGIFCDGAKGSCALKIASSMDGAILSFHLARRGKNIPYNDGIIAKEFEKTITNLGKLAKVGMKPLNDMIVDLMYQEELISE